MNFFVAVILSVVVVFLSLPVINLFQLEGYKVRFRRGFFAFYGKWFFVKKKKTPLVYTARVQRLMFSIFAISIVFFILIFFAGRGIGHEYAFLPLPILLTLPLDVFALFVMAPIEKLIQKYYIKKTRKLFRERENLIKIGITGSFGKTSVKFILEKMLSYVYNVVATPKSFNTPMGIALAAAKITDETEVFIAEMGARRRGDIAELCDIVRPSYGIITGITGQHLETFGDIAAVCETKFELIKALPKSGFAVFNGASEHTAEMFKAAHTDKVLSNVTSNLVTTAGGSSFIITIGSQSVQAKTPLVGRHNVENIGVAASMAYKLGVSMADIAEACANLEFIPHRLEVLRLETGVTVLDDSYNSNFQGFLSAIETLSLFPGRKILATPGLVEVGADGEKINKILGGEAAKIAQFAFLIGGNAEALKAGMLSAGFSEANIMVCETLAEAQEKFPEVLKPGDVLLIENDLPDNF